MGTLRITYTILGVPYYTLTAHCQDFRNFRVWGFRVWDLGFRV